MALFVEFFFVLYLPKKPGQTGSFCKFVRTPGQAIQNRDVPGKTGTSGDPSIQCTLKM